MKIHRSFISLYAATALLFLYGLGTPAVKGELLSDNLNQPTDYTEEITGNAWIAAGFNTGASAYTLTDVQLLLSWSAGPSILALYSDSRAQPGALLGALISPSTYSTDLTPTLFGGNGLPLTANTNYWLVLTAPAGDVQWAYTDSNYGSGVGFQSNWAASYNAGLLWSTSDLSPMQLSVSADPSGPTTVPEPAAVWLCAAGGLLVCLGITLRKVRNVR